MATLALSLGGVETLVTHPASTSHRELDEAALGAAGIAPGLVRMSVGIEDVEDLWADVEQALGQAAEQARGQHRSRPSFGLTK